MADPKFPYVKWHRDGRPRSSHGAYARALGFVDADLRHPPHGENGRPVGAWFNLQEASDFSDKRRSEIEAAAAALANCQKRLRSGSAPRSRIFWTTGANRPEFKALSAASPIILSQVHLRHPLPAADARGRCRRCVPKSVPPSCSAWPSPAPRRFEAIATATPSSIGKPELRAFYNYAKSARGHHMALAMIATLSAYAFTQGYKEKHPVASRTQPARRNGVRSSGWPHRAGRDAGIYFPRGSQQPMRSNEPRSATAFISRCSPGSARPTA